MKLKYVLLILFVVVGHLQELKTIHKDIENMQEQIKTLNDHIKELKSPPEHIEQFIQLANEETP